MLPAIYSRPADAQHVEVRIRATALWAGPDATYAGRTAARLTFWPECPLKSITVALPGRGKRSRPGFVVEQRRLSPVEVVELGKIRATTPSVTAVDLACTSDGGEIVDRALRSRTATLEQMWDVLGRDPYRPGNEQRAALLRDSRDEPWSEASACCTGCFEQLDSPKRGAATCG